jgi:hypothetical protein
LFAKLIPDRGIKILLIDGSMDLSRHIPVYDSRDNLLFIAIQLGTHSVEVFYNTTDSKGNRVWSEGSVTFEHRYLFEGGSYTFTGTPEGNKIIFRMERQ